MTRLLFRASHDIHLLPLGDVSSLLRLILLGRSGNGSDVGCGIVV
jgi:hypothetical protein